jgi:predicted permease
MFRRRRSDEALDADVRLHLDLLTEEYERNGLTPEAARLAARRAFGGVEPMKERYREARGLGWFEDLWRDIRYAVRMLRRDRGLAAIAVVTLALGIGANTAIFSVIDALMLRPLPVPNPGDLRLLTNVFPATDIARAGRGPGFSFSYPLYEDIRTKADAFSGVIAIGNINSMRVVIGGGSDANAGPAEVAETQNVSGNFFSVLGVSASIGRTLVPADDDPSSPVPAVVLSDGFWARRFGRDPGVVGSRIVINDVPFTIVGIAPAEFRGVQVGAEPDLWWPNRFQPRLFAAPPNLMSERLVQNWRLIGRLRPGADERQAAAQVKAIFQADLAERLERRLARPGATVTPEDRRIFLEQTVQLDSAAAGWTSVRWRFQRPLLALMAVVALVLLIACANVANLLLARAAARRREIAVRMALGSGRYRLIGQLITESVLLAGIGGALGLGVAYLGSQSIPSFMAAQDMDLRVGPDIRVLSFAFLVSIGSAFVFGLMPALSATRVDFTAALTERTRAGGAGNRFGLHNAILVSQVALSVVVLVAAGLFVRTLTNLLDLETGFARENLTVFNLEAPLRYDGERRIGVYEAVIDALQTRPDVKASYSFFGLLSGNGWSDRFEIPGYTPPPGERMDDMQLMVVGPGFFDAVGSALVLGRTFERADETSPVRVAIVNETMARRFFGREPLGRRVVIGAFPNDIFEIVGVAPDAKYRTLRQEAEGARPAMYLPSFQPPGRSMAVRLRDAQVEVLTPAGLAGIEPLIRRVARDADPSVVVTELRSMATVIDRTISQERMLARLSTWLGLLALALSAIGIYGVRSYTVSRRTSEIGLRIALGATVPHVLRLVVGQGVVMTVLGIAIGLALGVALSRYVQTLLFAISPTDPVTLAAVAILLLVIAVLASYAPARRAIRVDPTTALRTD